MDANNENEDRNLMSSTRTKRQAIDTNSRCSLTGMHTFTISKYILHHEYSGWSSENVTVYYFM